MHADVAIIGAGPAGSSAAITLARAGRTAVVFEAKRFPREKVCGGCLSGEATAQLRSLLGPSAALPGIPAEQISFVIGSCRLNSNPWGRTRLITRPELDTCLADAAASAGADVRYGQAASLERGNTGWGVFVGEECWKAGHVLVASGTGRLTRMTGISGRPIARRLVSQRWTQPVVEPLPRLGSVELHWLRGGYVGLATPKPGVCVVATAVEAEDLDGEPPFERLRRLNPHAPILHALARGGCMMSLQGTAGFPWHPTNLGRENLLLVGDAAGYEEPYTGDGMGQAMFSGRCAAEAVLAGGDIQAGYAALMRRHHHPGMTRTRLLSWLLRRSCVQRAAALGALPTSLFSGMIDRIHVRGER